VVPEVHFLGMIFSEKGIFPDDKNTKAIKDFPRPTTHKGIRQFLGLTGFFRKFVLNYAKIALPLNKLLRKGEDFTWSQDCETSFQELKRILINKPVLQLPNYDQDFVLQVDTSSQALGYILSTKDENNRMKPILYGGLTLQRNQQNYSSMDLEF
jgi:hypothetical protein